MSSPKETLEELIREAFDRYARKARGSKIAAAAFVVLAIWSYGEGWIFWAATAIAIFYVTVSVWNSYTLNNAKRARLLDVVMNAPTRMVWVGIESTALRRLLVQFHDDRGEFWLLSMPQERSAEIRSLIFALFPDAYVGPTDGKKFSEWRKDPSAPRSWPRQSENR